MFDRISIKKSARQTLSHFTAKTIPVTLAAGLIMMCLSAADVIRTGAPLCESGFSLDAFMMMEENEPRGSGITALLSIIISGAVEMALAWYYISVVKNRDGTSFSTFLEGFSGWIRGILASLWTSLWTFLWTLVFIIPGIVKTIAYSQIYVILAENPDISVRKAMKISMAITKGYKADIFLLYLSFFGWMLVGLLTACIGFLWVIPYVRLTNIHLYAFLKERALASGAVTLSDFTGNVQ